MNRNLAARCAFAVTAAAAATLAAGALTASASAAAPALTHYQQKVSALVSVPPSSQVRATVTCPVGTNVVGGGALTDDNVLTEGLNTSNPDFDGRTWVVRFNNTDENNFAHFNVYAVCVSGVQNYQRIEGLGVDNPGATQSTAQANCPTGTVVLGGGGNLTSPQTTSYLNSTRPVNNGWRVTAANANPADDDFIQPYAICGQRPAGYHRVTGTPSTLKTFGQGQAAAACSAGTKVLSGGGQSSSTSQSVSMNSSAPSSNRIWQVFENNIANVPSNLTAYAVCGTTT